MSIDYDKKEQMDKLVRSYIEGIQWVLYYYYNGVASWGWFYPYHYAPMISDLKDLDRFSDLEFTLGNPFKAYEQLMGVLPSLSRKLLPAAYRVRLLHEKSPNVSHCQITNTPFSFAQDLMTDPTSPIIDFYPTDFDLDMNGKKQDWEAIVKIPFIDEERLLSAMKSREHRLTKDQAAMERIGQSYRIFYDANLETTQDEDGNGLLYPSPLPGVFPDIHNCLAKQVDYDLPTLDGGLKLRKALLKETNVGIHALAGFPTLHTIPHTGFLVHHNVNVFQQESK
jgi:5'-3' exoribonuclease 1